MAFLGGALGSLGSLENGDSEEEMLAEKVVFLGFGVRMVALCGGWGGLTLDPGASLD